MTPDELTKEYLMRTFDFESSTPTDFITKYFEVYDEISSTYRSIKTARDKEAHDKFYGKL